MTNTRRTLCVPKRVSIARPHGAAFSSSSTGLYQQKSRPLFVDSDAGFDDILAISSLLNTNNSERTCSSNNNTSNNTTSNTTANTTNSTNSNSSAMSTSASISIPFISTVSGIQSCPERSARFLKKIFPAAQVLPGRTQRKLLDTSHPPRWLLDFRNGLNGIMDSFDVGVMESHRNRADSCTAIDIDIDIDKGIDIGKGIAEVLKDYADDGVDLMCLGPLTNIASWIQDDEVFPIIQSKINRIWIMGGNIPAGTGIGTRIGSDGNAIVDDASADADANEAEFNFAQDPRAVAVVLGNKAMRDKIYILPAQTCQKYSPSVIEWNKLMDKGTKGTGILSKVLNATTSWDDLKYDPLCAFSYAMPQSISYSKMHIKVNEETGLLTRASSMGDEEEDGNDSAGVNIIVDVTIDTEEGFLKWLSVGIDHDKSIS